MQEMKVLEDKITTLNQQNGQIELLWKDLYSIAERLKIVGNKLNSIDHPENKQVENSKGTLVSSKICPLPTDGLVGDLNANISYRSLLIDEFNNQIYGKLIRNLDYIEQHI